MSKTKIIVVIYIPKTDLPVTMLQVITVLILLVVARRITATERMYTITTTKNNISVTNTHNE